MGHQWHDGSINWGARLVAPTYTGGGKNRVLPHITRRKWQFQGCDRKDAGLTFPEFENWEKADISSLSVCPILSNHKKPWTNMWLVLENGDWPHI